MEESNFNFRYVRLCYLDVPREKMTQLFANSGDPDHSVASDLADLGMHCLPICPKPFANNRPESFASHLQAVETLIRRRILRRLIWVCTVFQMPYY